MPTKECLVYITNMCNDDFSHGILEIVMIIFERYVLNIKRIYLILGIFLITIYSTKKLKNYRKNRVTKNDESFVGHVK